jgi:hypothetical protein
MADSDHVSRLLEDRFASRFPELQFSSDEVQAVESYHRKVLDKQLEKDLDGLVERVLKPRLEVLEAAKERADDSSVDEEVRAVAPSKKAPSRVAPSEFPSITPLSIQVMGPYTLGYPDPAQGFCSDLDGGWSSVGHADRMRGRMSIGARVGMTSAAPHPLCNDDPFFVFQANRAMAGLTQVVRLPTPLPEDGFMRATAEVVVDASPYLFRLLPGNRDNPARGMVGVAGWVHLTVYGSDQVAWSSTLLRVLRSHVPSLDETMITLNEPIYVSGSARMRGGDQVVAVAVDVTLIAFRDDVVTPPTYGGFAAVNLTDPLSDAPVFLGGGVILTVPPAHVIVPSIHLTFVPRNVMPPGQTST